MSAALLPMQCTYGDAIRIVLRGRSLTEDEVLSYFAPKDRGAASDALRELLVDGKVDRVGGRFSLGCFP